jgi:hypothetical protein
MAFIIEHAPAQGILIQPGGNLKTTGNVSVVIQNGGITNNGTSDFSSADVYLTQTSTTSSLGGSGGLKFGRLYINKTAGNVRLDRDIEIATSLVFQSGNLNLNNYNIILSSMAAITGETNTRHITGINGGEISITVNLNAPSNANPGNLGAIITSTKDLGAVTVRRGHKVQLQNGAGKSIRRYYVITPANNTALNATFRFKYFNVELNGVTESQLVMFRSINDGISWTNIGYTAKSATEDYVEYKPQNVFKRYTLSSPTFATTAIAYQTITNEAVKKELYNYALDVYPNPANNNAIITINAPRSADRASLQVTDATGKTVLKQNISVLQGKNQIFLNTAGLATGNYLVSFVVAGEYRQTIKLVKSK